MAERKKKPRVGSQGGGVRVEELFNFFRPRVKFLFRRDFHPTFGRIGGCLWFRQGGGISILRSGGEDVGGNVFPVFSHVRGARRGRGFSDETIYASRGRLLRGRDCGTVGGFCCFGEGNKKKGRAFWPFFPPKARIGGLARLGKKGSGGVFGGCRIWGGRAGVKLFVRFVVWFAGGGGRGTKKGDFFGPAFPSFTKGQTRSNPRRAPRGVKNQNTGIPRAVVCCGTPPKGGGPIPPNSWGLAGASGGEKKKKKHFR